MRLCNKGRLPKSCISFFLSITPYKLSLFLPKNKNSATDAEGTQYSARTQAQNHDSDRVLSLILNSVVRKDPQPYNKLDSRLRLRSLRKVVNKRVMGSDYKYKRLDLGTDAIRLIRLHMGRGGSIQCDMFETYLSELEGVPYEALSYVWGDKESADRIWVNGCLFTVTANLFEALSNLRQPGEDRLLWVDAICIDQNHPAVSNNSDTWCAHIPARLLIIYAMRLI